MFLKSLVPSEPEKKQLQDGTSKKKSNLTIGHPIVREGNWNEKNYILSTLTIFVTPTSHKLGQIVYGFTISFCIYSSHVAVFIYIIYNFVNKFILVLKMTMLRYNRL